MVLSATCVHTAVVFLTEESAAQLSAGARVIRDFPDALGFFFDFSFAFCTVCHHVSFQFHGPNKRAKPNFVPKKSRVWPVDAFKWWFHLVHLRLVCIRALV